MVRIRTGLTWKERSLSTEGPLRIISQGGTNRCQRKVLKGYSEQMRLRKQESCPRFIMTGGPTEVPFFKPTRLVLVEIYPIYLFLNRHTRYPVLDRRTFF